MKTLDDFLELIKNGKISIREASRQSGYTRDFLRKSLNEKYGIDSVALESLQDVVNKNKANSNIVNIDSKLLEEVFLRTISGEITLSEARDKISEEIGNIDDETLKEHFLRFIQDNRNNEELLMKYREYKKQGHITTSEKTDIENLNFRLLAIQMLKERLSQSDIAKQIGVPPRTVSRKFEEFKNDEDPTLYHMIKFYNYKVMRRQKLTGYEEFILNLAISTYKQNHPDLLSAKTKSKAQEKIEKIQMMVAEAAQLKQEGFTQAEIAQKLGTSISSLRRARIFLEEHELLNGTQTAETKPTEKTDHDNR